MNESHVVLHSGTEHSRIVPLTAEHFTIDPTALDVDLCRLAAVMIEYAEVEVELGAEVERREAALQRWDADQDLAIRSTPGESGARVTETRIQSMVRVHPDRATLVERLVESKRNHNLMRWVMRAMQGKKDCLIALTYREKALIQSERY